MSQLDDLKVKYTADLEAIGESVDANLLHAVAKGLGPSIYNRDSATVAGSDQKELDTVKNSFLIKKLGVSESEDLDGAIQAVIDKIRPQQVKQASRGGLLLTDQALW